MIANFVVPCFREILIFGSQDGFVRVNVGKRRGIKTTRKIYAKGIEIKRKRPHEFVQFVEKNLRLKTEIDDIVITTEICL